MIVYANGRLTAIDVEGNTQDIGVVGPEQDTLKVSDDESKDLLYAIIKELKMLNLHMASITDLIITSSEVEV